MDQKCIHSATGFILQEIVLQSKVTALGHQGQQLRSVQLSPKQQRQQLFASPANRQRSIARSSRSEDEGNFRLRCVIAGQAKQIGTRTAGGLMLNWMHRGIRQFSTADGDGDPSSPAGAWQTKSLAALHPEHTKIAAHMRSAHVPGPTRTTIKIMQYQQDKDLQRDSWSEHSQKKSVIECILNIYQLYYMMLHFAWSYRKNILESAIKI